MPAWVNTWAFYVVYAMDLLTNALVAGSPHETISSRCYRLNYLKPYRALEVVLDALFYPFQGTAHCQQSYQDIVAGTYLPSHFYNRVIDEANAMNKHVL